MVFAFLSTFAFTSCDPAGSAPDDPHTERAYHSQEVPVLTAQIVNPASDTSEVVNPETDTEKTGPFDELPNNVKLTEMYNYWYGIVLALLGYLSYIIPGIKRWQNVGARVLAIGFVVGALFLSFGWADIWQLLTSFLFTTLIYDKALSPFVKSPK